MKSLTYRDGHGREIYVAVPWGNHSGDIPPPAIEFSTGTFVYQGDGPDVRRYVRRPGRQSAAHGGTDG